MLAYIIERLTDLHHVVAAAALSHRQNHVAAAALSHRQNHASEV